MAASGEAKHADTLTCTDTLRHIPLVIIQAQVFDFLNTKLDKCYAEMEKYQVHIGKLMQELAAAHDLRDRDVAAMEKRKNDELAQLRRDLKHMEDEMERVMEFKLHREQLLADFASLQTQLAEEQERFAAEKYELERKNIAERQHIKNTMYNRMLATKEEIIREMVNGVDDTVRRTMAENEHMVTELTYQSAKAEELMAENDKLKRANRGLTSAKMLLEQQIAQLIQRTHRLQRVVRAEQQDAATLRAKLLGSGTLVRPGSAATHTSGSGSRPGSSSGKPAAAAGPAAPGSPEQLGESGAAAKSPVAVRHKQLAALAQEQGRRIAELEDQLAATMGDMQRREEQVDDVVAFLLQAMEDIKSDAAAREQLPAAGDAVMPALLSSPELRAAAVDTLMRKLHLFQERAVVAASRAPSVAASMADNPGSLADASTPGMQLGGVPSASSLPPLLESITAGVGASSSVMGSRAPMLTPIKRRGHGPKVISAHQDSPWGASSLSRASPHTSLTRTPGQRGRMS